MKLTVSRPRESADWLVDVTFTGNGRQAVISFWNDCDVTLMRCDRAATCRGCSLEVKRDHSTDELVMLGYTAKAFQTPIIVQSRKSCIPWIPGLSVLYDASGGLGRSPDTWPSPEWVYQPLDVAAYAGGHAPDNIRERLPLLSKARGNGLFAIDMESGVRTDDWFDLNKVCAVLAAVRDWEAGESAQAGRAVA